MKNRGCVLLLLSVAVLGGWFAWSARRGPSVSTVPLSQLPPAQQQQRRVEARELETQVREVARAARQGEKKPFEIVVTNEQINTLLEDRLDTSQFPLRDLRVGFEPGEVVAQGQVNYKGLATTATLSGEVVLENGKIAFRTRSLSLSGIPAPSDWSDTLNKTVTQKLQEALAKAPGRLDSVRVEKGRMIVSGQTN
jgi:hypothetical protein